MARTAAQRDEERAEGFMYRHDLDERLQPSHALIVHNDFVRLMAAVRAEERASLQLECEAAHLAAEERGRAEERAAIVAYINESAILLSGHRVKALVRVAAEVDRGEHEEGT